MLKDTDTFHWIRVYGRLKKETCIYMPFVVSVVLFASLAISTILIVFSHISIILVQNLFLFMFVEGFSEVCS